MTISSKWGYVYTADWEVDADPPEVKHHDVETFQRQLEETRANLGDWLDLYQIHSATPESGVLENDAVLSAMPRPGCRSGFASSGVSPGRDDRPRRLAGHLQRGPGDLEPARARRGAALRALRPG